MTTEVLKVQDSPGTVASGGQPSCPTDRSEPKDVSVILPVYRNRITLVELHRRLTDVLQGAAKDYELIFVDDACPEASSELLMEMACGDPHVRLLTLERNIGQQRAVLAGLTTAAGMRVIIMDADLQDPPEAIPALLAKSAEGFEAVFAGRRGNYESTGRLLTSRLYKWMLHRACGVPPDAGIFMVLGRKTAGRLALLNEPHPAMVAMVGCAGTTMTSIPVERSVRPAGRSAYSSRQRLMAGVNALIRVPLWKRRLRLKATDNREGGTA